MKFLIIHIQISPHKRSTQVSLASSYAANTYGFRITPEEIIFKALARCSSGIDDAHRIGGTNSTVTRGRKPKVITASG